MIAGAKCSKLVRQGVALLLTYQVCACKTLSTVHLHRFSVLVSMFQGAANMQTAGRGGEYCTPKIWRPTLYGRAANHGFVRLSISAPNNSARQYRTRTRENTEN